MSRSVPSFAAEGQEEDMVALERSGLPASGLHKQFHHFLKEHKYIRHGGLRYLGTRRPAPAFVVLTTSLEVGLGWYVTCEGLSAHPH